MTRRNKILLGAGGAATLLAGAISASAMAQTRSLPMDANGDGQVTIAEISQAAQQRFAAFDVDKDGKLAGAEIQLMQESRGGWGRNGGPGRDRGPGRGRGDMPPPPPPGAAPAPGAQQAGVPNDFDGDGTVTLDEYSRGVSARSIAMDTNSDGTITAEEFRAGFRGRRGEGPGH